MVTSKIFAGQTAAEALSVLSREKKVLFILTPILAVVLVFIAVPLWGLLSSIFFNYLFLFASFVQMGDQTLNQANELNFWLLALVIPGLFAFSLTTMAWVRATISGRKSMWTGGFSAVVKRGFWTGWRLFAGLVWLVVVTLFWSAIFYVYTQFLESLTITGYGPWMQKLIWFAIIVTFLGLYLAIMLASSAVALAAGTSIAAEATGVRLPVHKSFRLLRKNLLRGASILTLMSFAFYLLFVGYLLTLATVFADNGEVWALAGLFLLYLLGLFFYFFWSAFGALYAIKLNPEVEQKAFRRQIEDVF